MRNTTRFVVPGVLLAGILGCSDTREPGSITSIEATQSHVVACDLRTAADAARRYLNLPYQQQVSDKLRTLQMNGCTGEANEKLAWEILRIVEHVFYNRLGNAPADGVRLVNGVLHCCIPNGNGVTVPEKALSAGGSFGVRGALAGATPIAVSDTEPILARDQVQIVFGSEDGSQVSRPAVFATRPRPPSTWQQLVFGEGVAGTFTDDVWLIHGGPTGLAQPYASYELNEAPNQGFQPGKQLDVIVCFTDVGTAPGGGSAFQARMRRNGVVLLETTTGIEDFCQQYVWGPLALASNERSLLSSVFALAERLLLPRPLVAAVLDGPGTPAIGGSPTDFSEFAPLLADVNGSLTFIQGPPAIVNNTTTQFPIAVEARSGGGTLMERVDVTLTLKTNLGAPGMIVGSFTDCDGLTQAFAVSCTQEPSGVASFLISISKAGGYILCAQASAEGFTFPEVCTAQFHVRN